MLEDLQQRLRELDELSGRRRPSKWQHTNSTGSVNSNGSVSYHSPMSMPPPAPLHRHQSSNASYTMPTFGEPTSQISPPPFPQQPPQMYQSSVPSYFPPTFDFNTAPGTAANLGPHQQFAHFDPQYGGPTGSHTMEELAVPPNAPWTLEPR